MTNQPAPTFISAMPGESMQQVQQRSSYDFELSPATLQGFQGYDIVKPKIIFTYTDAKHSLTFPETIYLAIAAIDGRIDNISFSPQIKNTNLSESIKLLEKIKAMLKELNWEPIFNKNMPGFDGLEAYFQDSHAYEARVGWWKSGDKELTLSLRLINRAEEVATMYPKKKPEDRFVVKVEFFDKSIVANYDSRAHKSS